MSDYIVRFIETSDSGFLIKEILIKEIKEALKEALLEAEKTVVKNKGSSILKEFLETVIEFRIAHAIDDTEQTRLFFQKEEALWSLFSDTCLKREASEALKRITTLFPEKERKRSNAFKERKKSRRW